MYLWYFDHNLENTYAFFLITISNFKILKYSFYPHKMLTATQIYMTYIDNIFQIFVFLNPILNQIMSYKLLNIVYIYIVGDINWRLA